MCCTLPGWKVWHIWDCIIACFAVTKKTSSAVLRGPRETKAKCCQVCALFAVVSFKKPSKNLCTSARLPLALLQTLFYCHALFEAMSSPKTGKYSMVHVCQHHLVYTFLSEYLWLAKIISNWKSAQLHCQHAWHNLPSHNAVHSG